MGMIVDGPLNLGKVELAGNRECVHVADAHLCVADVSLQQPNGGHIVTPIHGRCPICESRALLPLAPILSGEARLVGAGVRR